MSDFLFDGWGSLGRTALSGGLAYAALVAFLRISGKRTLAKMSAFDFVVTVAIGSTLATVLTSRDLPLANGLLALGLLISLQFGVAWLAVRVPPFERLVKSRPRAVARDGTLDRAALREERLTPDEIFAALRAHGVEDFARVRAVVLETDGSMSVLEETGQTPGVPAAGERSQGR